MQRTQTDYRLDIRKEEHRAMVLRAYFQLLAEGKGMDVAWGEAPETAVERWRSGFDWPVTVYRRLR